MRTRAAAWRLIALAAGALATNACGSSDDGKANTGPPSSSPALTGCEPGLALAGGSYDVGRSRFAFGSTPVAQHDAGLTRWVGADGALAIFANGSVGASLNGGAPEASEPPWSNDPAAVATHVRDYFLGMGVVSCQAPDAQVVGGSVGLSGGLPRAIDSIPIAESYAWATFDAVNQTTAEGFYWPAISADVVTAARAFRDRLADPAALAAFKALLPAGAQGDGQVLIHHTDASSTSSTFKAVAVYDVLVPDPLGLSGNRQYDQTGKDVTGSW